MKSRSGKGFKRGHRRLQPRYLTATIVSRAGGYWYSPILLRILFL